MTVVHWSHKARTRLREIHAYIAYRLIFQASPGRIDILTIKHYRQRLPAQATDL
jgi:plasmid stabilization system protein ParE